MKKKVHFIGIGGIGMSALARWFLSQNWAVSGSDLMPSEITKELAKEGARVKIGHKKGNIKSNIDIVVYNRAIDSRNPELVAARSLGTRTIPYAKLLGMITKEYTTIAITGSHGKTTTTALAGLVLMKGGFDPTVFVGTNLKELGNKNFRLGGRYLVLEADDFGGAFLEYSPTIAVITNIDKEHLDFYKNFSNLKKAFLKFLGRTKDGGTFVLNREDKHLRSLKSKVEIIAKKKKIRIVWYSLSDTSIGKIKKVISIPGEHNLANAEAAYQIGKILRIPDRLILSGIGSYRGAWRRMEYRGKFQVSSFKLQVFDDYAHHPTEVKATLKAFKEKFPKSKLICVFQPHQAERLRVLFKDFVRAFDDADVLILLPIYKVPGRDPSTSSRRVKASQFTSKRLFEAIKHKYPQKSVFYLDNPKNLKRFLSKILYSTFYILHSPVVIMMGAGDIVDYTNYLLE